MSRIYINTAWFNSKVPISPLNQLSNDIWSEIISYMDPLDMIAFAKTCKTMHKMLSLCLEMLLCEGANDGTLVLTYITEHKWLIDRVRVHCPDFTPGQFDYKTEELEWKDSEDLKYLHYYSYESSGSESRDFEPEDSYDSEYDQEYHDLDHTDN